MGVSNRHIEYIQRRIDFLTERIDVDSPNSGYDKAECAALKSVIQYLDDEQTNVAEARAFKKGQIATLKGYKKILKKAVKSENISSLQFLLDKTNEWLDDAETKQL